MNKLEHFLDQYDNKELDWNELVDYEKFGYDDELIYNHHLKFLLDNCYTITLKDKSRKRLNQTEFRKELLAKYNKCIITDEDCEHSLEACHIIPISEKETYDIDNGLLLRSDIHKTFDKYLWSINPITLKVEIKENLNVGAIKKYVGQKVKISINSELENNLENHYNLFKKN
jgi:predicted restriction endonuclease